MALALLHEDATMGALSTEVSWDNELVLWHDVTWLNQGASTPDKANGNAFYKMDIDISPGRKMANNQKVVIQFLPFHVDADLQVSMVTRTLISS